MNRVLLATLSAALVLGATGTKAQTAPPPGSLMTVKYFGTVQAVNWAGGTSLDGLGLFGTADDSLAGSAFEARYVFDLFRGDVSDRNDFYPLDLVGITSTIYAGTATTSPALEMTVSVGSASWQTPGLPNSQFVSSYFEIGTFNGLGTPQRPAFSNSFQTHSVNYDAFVDIDGSSFSDAAFVTATGLSTTSRIPTGFAPFDITFASTERGNVDFGMTRYAHDIGTLQETAFTALIDRMSVSFADGPPPPPPPPGVTPDDPIMPTDVGPDGEFIFTFEAQPDRPLFWDPVVSVGYDYNIAAGGGASQLWFVDLGDLDGYELYLWNDGSLDYDFFGSVSAGTWIDIGGITSRFRLLGIDPTLELDPTDPLAFITGAIGLNGSVQLTMTPITFDTDAGPGVVPEPASWAMMIAGFGLVGATMRRRRRAFA